jgi:hypothetical protein
VIEQDRAIRHHSDFEVLVSALRSVARIRLVKMENPSECATVNCKVCRTAIAL